MSSRALRAEYVQQSRIADNGTFEELAVACLKDFKERHETKGVVKADYEIVVDEMDSNKRLAVKLTFETCKVVWQGSAEELKEE